MNSLTFSNGLSIPTIGLGTWTTPKNKIYEAVKSALEVGYRHVDCAFVYLNEDAVGNALRACLPHFDIKREDIFITSKCWCTYLRPELVRKCCEHSLKDLKLSYLDLYLVHWPVAMMPGAHPFPLRADGRLDVDKVPLLETWKAMEDLVDAGLVKSIGMSNFNKHQIDLIMDNCRIKPVNLQVEVHANFPNTKLVDYAQSKGLTVTAYAPLGSPAASPGSIDLLTVDWVLKIANSHKKTPAQVLLRYLLQRNLIVIPKSTKPSHILQNYQIFDFTLSESEMHILNTNGTHVRQFMLSDMEESDEYPFNDEF